jgi:hydrogenase expression/formation protein HypE
MEVCGGQTHSIVKYGLDRLLPSEVELVHGPGCPVCVTSLEMIDKAHAIAQRPDVIFCSFGDMLRVPTRGGVASALNEIAEKAQVGIRIEESRIPVRDDSRGACEILGFDPLYVANEGKILAFVPQEDAGKVLAAMRAHPLGKDSTAIGQVTADSSGRVVMKTRIGGTRIVDMLSGDQLPRIC